MSKIIKKTSRITAFIFLILAGFVLLTLSTIAAGPSKKPELTVRGKKLPAATPSSGMLNPAGGTVTWSGTVLGVNVFDETTCADGATCDTYTVTLSGTPADWTGKKARVTISWDFTLGDDFDVVIHKGSNSGPVVGSATTSDTANPEVLEIDPNAPNVGTGIFTVHVIYFFAFPTDTYNGEATVVGAAATPTPNPTTTPTPTPLPVGQPRFQTYAAPRGIGEDAGEPSIGSNWQSENVVRTDQTFANSNGPIPNGGTTNYYGGFLSEMLRITFDDCSSPAKDLWEKKPLFLAATPRPVGDPILFTDHTTGRTFVTQEESAAGATTDVTDDDGETFQPSQGAGVPAGIDHETIGGGPYALPTPNPTPSYPHAVYYASQNVSDARCSRSDDGGITFGPAIPMFTGAQCAGLHGHIKVAPDGTVYVPDKACGLGLPGVLGGKASVIVSEDNGITWNIRTIPDGDSFDEWDASAGVATDGTLYVGYQGTQDYGNGMTGTPARIAVSHNKGVTWSPSVDVGAQLGIKNMVFPTVVAGDPDRAAFAFYGTTTPDGPNQDHTGGTNNDPTLFTGDWYLFVATTFDGGMTWVTQNVTPNDPVQRGPICGDSTCRNLLDFFDATIDKRGRVLVGWEDGCIGGCANGGPNSFTAKATISRQSGGKRMFGVYDPSEPILAGAPRVSGYLNAAHTAIELSWPQPDNGGSTITAYKIYRRIGTGGAFTLLATTNVPSYHDDTGFDANSNNDYYHVTAVNDKGEGPYCGDFVPSPIPPPTPCVLPGILAIDDVNADGSDNDSGQNTPIDGSVNVKKLFVAEPFVSPVVDKLFFTIQVAPSILGYAPPNSQWYIIWNRQGTDTGDPNDALFDRMYVAMKTDANGTPSFEYGKFGIPINTSPPPPPDPNANTPKKVGDADSGSYDPLTGLIKITLSNDKLRAIEVAAGPTYGAGSDLAGLNVRTYFNRPDPGQRSQNNASDITDDSSYSLVGNASCASPPQLVRAFSRKMHLNVGTFDIRLFPGSDGIECRDGGANKEYQVVFSFATPVTFTGASVTPAAGGTAHVVNTTTNGNEVIVNLDNVSNEQTITVSLLGAAAGGPPSDLSVKMGVLFADANANKSVTGSDVNGCKAVVGLPVTEDSFRYDVNLTGTLTGSDVNVIKGQVGTSLP